MTVTVANDISVKVLEGDHKGQFWFYPNSLRRNVIYKVLGGLPRDAQLLKRPWHAKDLEA